MNRLHQLLWVMAAVVTLGVGSQLLGHSQSALTNGFLYWPPRWLEPVSVPGPPIAAQCQGVDDTTTLGATITAARGRTLVISPGEVCAAGDLTIPNLRIERGGLLKPTSGHTITLTGSFEAGVYQTFTNVDPGQGTVLFHSSPVTADGKTEVVQVYPQYWGCVADYEHDCGPALMAAINSGARRIFLPGGGYGIRTAVTIRNNNFVIEGDSRVYTDLLPLAADIHVGNGPNAMFVNSQNITNCIIEKVRFTSLIAFNGWAIWAQDGVQGGEALFSSIIRNCWISMGNSSAGFFHGALNGSFFEGNEIENTNVVFDLIGSGNAGSQFINNRMTSCNSAFINSTASPSNEMMVRGLQVFSHRRGVVLDIKNGLDWQISNITLDYDGGGKLSGGLINLDTCKQCDISIFYAKQEGGKMSAFGIKDSQVRVSNGYVIDPDGTADTPHAFTFRGEANDVSINEVTVQGGTGNLQQVYFDDGCAGDFRIVNSKFQHGPSGIFGTGRNVKANIDIRDNHLLNGYYAAGRSAGQLLNLSTSGRLHLVNNVIGVDDKKSTTAADLALGGTGEVFVSGNTFVGTQTVPVFDKGSSQVARVANNEGLASTYYSDSMPTSGSWNRGDVVHVASPVETGSRGSKYILVGWIRITSGSTNVLNKDWMEMRTLTGN